MCSIRHSVMKMADEIETTSNCREFDGELRVRSGSRIVELLIYLDSKVCYAPAPTRANFAIGELARRELVTKRASRRAFHDGLGALQADRAAGDGGNARSASHISSVARSGSPSARSPIISSICLPATGACCSAA